MAGSGGRDGDALVDARLSSLVVRSTGRCVLFAQDGADHLDLLSFPTRRSSDLDPPPRRPGTRARGGGGVDLRSDAGLRPDQRDRKSTRLNSSHTVISYAVFCLKRKIIKPLLRTCKLTLQGACPDDAPPLFGGNG